MSNDLLDLQELLNADFGDYNVLSEIRSLSVELLPFLEPSKRDFDAHMDSLHANTNGKDKDRRIGTLARDLKALINFIDAVQKNPDSFDNYQNNKSHHKKAIRSVMNDIAQQINTFKKERNEGKGAAAYWTLFDQLLGKIDNLL